MKKKIICVMGRQGSGKTTYCRMQDYYVLPGQECRRKFGEKAFADNKNPSCPDFSEQFVRSCIIDALEKLPQGRTLYVDGFPRSLGQASWLSKEVGPYANISVEFVTCGEEERRGRIIGRDRSNEDAIALANARELKESNTLLPVLVELNQLGYSWSIVDNSSREISIGVCKNKLDDITPKSTMSEIWRLHKELLDIGGAKFPDEVFKTGGPIVAGTMRAKSIRDMFRHLMMECQEALDEIPDKSWPIPDLTTDLRKVQVELVDAFHFLVSCAMALGMDADEFVQLYDWKRKINIKRQTQGYLKTKQQEG